MITWIDRFFKMSPNERAMTVAEDPSTLAALVVMAVTIDSSRTRHTLISFKVD